jgi:hypothetical protein
LARWRRADIGNAMLMEYNWLAQRMIELGAAMDGVADGAISVVTGIVDIAVLLYKGVKAWIEFNIRMVKASYEFVADLSMEDVRAIGENVRNLVGEVITTAQEIKDKIILGAKIFNAAMSDGLVREAIVQYMDGYTESVSLIQNINNIAKFIGAAVGEILLFLAFAPAQQAKLAAQGTVMIGRFSIKLIQLISRLGRAILARAEQAARAVKHTIEVIPERLGEAARKVGDAVDSVLRRDVVPDNPSVVSGQGSYVRMDGHKIYDSNFPALSTNPSAQYRFSDPSYRSTGGDVYFGENVVTSYMEVRKNLDGKSLFVGEVRVDNILDLTDPKVLKQMDIDPAKLTARVDNPVQQKAVYGYTNQVSNQAYDAGYNGILYPSSRKAGNNQAITLFDGRYDPDAIKLILDRQIKP